MIPVPGTGGNKYPESKRRPATRLVVAYTTDGREITVPTKVVTADYNLAWADWARIEEA